MSAVKTSPIGWQQQQHQQRQGQDGSMCMNGNGPMPTSGQSQVRTYNNNR